jgi:hypothetical protein
VSEVDDVDDVSDAATIGRPARRATFFLAMMLAGAALAHLAMPSLFHLVPNASLRVEVVLDALARNDLKPEVVIFGSSISATAIHDTTLSAGLPTKPLVMNLSTQLQSLAEAAMLYQELPPSTRLVVQQLTPWELVEREPLTGVRFNAYYSFGYRPEPATVELLSSSFGDAMHRTLTASHFEQTFRQRWIVSRLFDVAFWVNLPIVLYVEAIRPDVFFFFNDNRRAGDEQYRFMLRRTVSQLSAPDDVAFEQCRKLLPLLTRHLKETGRTLVLFVPPFHPEIRTKTPSLLWKRFDQLIAEARRAGAGIVDLRDALDDGGFRDGVHLTLDATESITRALAKGLVDAGLDPKASGSPS